MTWSEKVIFHNSRSVLSSWTHLWCFHRSSLSLSKAIAEKLLVTLHDLKWPLRHDERSLVAIFQFGVSSLPANRYLRVFRMVFVQKIPFYCLPLTHNGEVAKSTWLWVTDIKIQKNIYEQGWQKRRRSELPFFRFCEKPEGVFKHPSRPGVDKVRPYFAIWTIIGRLAMCLYQSIFVVTKGRHFKYIVNVVPNAGYLCW